MPFGTQDYDRLMKECIFSHSKWCLVYENTDGLQLRDAFNLANNTYYIDVESDLWAIYKYVNELEDSEFIEKFETLKLAEKEIKKYV